MPRFPVQPDKQKALEEEMARLGIREEDLEERFVRGAGRGGQKLNKTSSSVWLLHRPSGLQVRCGESRSQGLNRFLARRRLAEALAARAGGGKARAERERIRKNKARRRRRASRKGAGSPGEDRSS